MKKIEMNLHSILYINRIFDVRFNVFVLLNVISIKGSCLEL